LVMTWASQAYNPGSNPGDRIFYTSSNTGARKKQQQNKKTGTMVTFRKEEEQIPDSVSSLTTLNIK
jgi:hypothetical protein